MKGLPLAEKYKVTEHAIERYEERFGECKYEYDILKKFIEWAPTLECVSNNANKGYEKWVSEKYKLAVVLDVKNFWIITIINQDETYKVGKDYRYDFYKNIMFLSKDIAMEKNK